MMLFRTCWKLLAAAAVSPAVVFCTSSVFADSAVPVSTSAPLKIFVLAGQSNMCGAGSIQHLDLLMKEKNEFSDALWNGTSFRERDDVYIKWGDQHGKLTVSRNSGYAYEGCFGPELMFGWTVGDSLDEKVLIIKTAWGGRSLAVDFRPPASGEGNDNTIKPIHYGWLYRAMVLDVLETLGNLGDYVVDYDNATGYELAGFVWFQGYSDLQNDLYVAEYKPNLVNLIRDVRADFDVPELPFIVGELGMHGLHPDGEDSERVMAMRVAEESVTLLDAFKNNSLFIRTAPYAVLNDTQYAEVFHYYGRADTYFHIGQAFGRGMLQLIANQKTKETLKTKLERNRLSAKVSDAMPVKVFILAGQSNMVGMGSLEHLDTLMKENNEFSDTLWDGYNYKERDDVYMKYDGNHGKLTASRTAGYAGKNSFGPELMFGWTVGNALDETVLLIKSAWGGKTLAVDFRPPASGEGSYSDVKPVQYGWFYRAMIMDVIDALDNIGDYIPGYDINTGFDLAGFVWFQGWNDMLSTPFVAEYGPNLANLIRDVRADLDVPDLPFIIGELGMHGLKPEGRGTDRVWAMRTAEQSVTLLDDFRNNTLFVRTAPFAVLNETAYNGIYHYNGRADTYYHIGQAFGQGMLQLLQFSKSTLS